jgi:type II secretory pathway component PulJ
MVNLARRYSWKVETGFTLVEVLVCAMMMFGVLFALYAIFDVSVRAFGYGGDRLEAVGIARLALGRMEREIRAAYPYDLTSDPPRRYLFLDPTDPTRPAVPSATRIAFGNETGGDHSIDGSEVIGYYLSGHDLKRSKGSSAQTLVDSVPTDGLRFTLCRSPDDCPPALAITNEAEIGLVRIELTVEVRRRGQDPARQTLATDVYLRNRAEQP